MHLGYATLHDDEIGVVNVELDRLEKRMDGLLGRFVSIAEILGNVRQCNLRVPVKVEIQESRTVRT